MSSYTIPPQTPFSISRIARSVYSATSAAPIAGDRSPRLAGTTVNCLYFDRGAFEIWTCDAGGVIRAPAAFERRVVTFSTAAPGIGSAPRQELAKPIDIGGVDYENTFGGPS